MTNLLIQSVTKTPDPVQSLDWEGDIPVVRGIDSVPIEICLKGVHWEGPVGIDIVFLIDNSGSMDGNDHDMARYSAIEDLIDVFEPTRNHLDRIAVITFNEDTADIVQDLKSWSQTRPTVHNLMDTLPSGFTPMADGMERANQLLMGTNGFYKIVILLSDGFPEPDNAANPQSDTIDDILIPQAFNNRIIYSTVFLRGSYSPADNWLLKDIAKRTDYISGTPLGDEPYYYFAIDDTASMIEKYRELFDQAKERVVPQDVIIQERLSDRLIVDPDVPVSFSGPGVVVTENIIGGITLDQAYQDFRDTNLFTTHLNELDGEVTLKFFVKLNRDTLTSADYGQGYVYVDVDVTQDSTVQYLEPIGASGSGQISFPLPQARIKFILGLQVGKSVSEDGTQITIQLANLTDIPIESVQVAECPSGFIDAYEIEDDFEFKPFDMLFVNRIVPWFYSKITRGLSTAITPRAKQKLLRGIEEILRKSYKYLFRRSALFDEHLCQFIFAEDHPFKKEYWRTLNQRGIYKLCKSFPPLGDKFIKFKVKDASYLLDSDFNPWLVSPVDAVTPKGIMMTLSNYRTKDMRAWKMILPNPYHSQLTSDIPKADIFTATCFLISDLRHLLNLFEGGYVPNPWRMLDSMGIEVKPESTRAGLNSVKTKVKVHNYGGAMAESSFKVKSYFMPYLKTDWPIPWGDMPPSGFDLPDLGITATPAFYASGERNTRVDFRSTKTHQFTFNQFRFVPPRGGSVYPVDPEIIKKVQNAIVVTTVDLKPAQNELIVGNNKAIEIARLKS